MVSAALFQHQLNDQIVIVDDVWPVDWSLLLIACCEISTFSIHNLIKKKSVILFVCFFFLSFVFGDFVSIFLKGMNLLAIFVVVSVSKHSFLQLIFFWIFRDSLDYFISSFHYLLSCLVEYIHIYNVYVINGSTSTKKKDRTWIGFCLG